MSKQKNLGAATLDTARGLAMIGVIYVHLMEPLSAGRVDAFFAEPAFAQATFIASFLIPLFFLLSGAAMSRFEAKSPRHVLQSSLQLIVLAYLSHFVALAVKALILLPQATPDNAIGALHGAVIDLVRGYLLLPPLWFLIALAVVRVAFYAIVRTARHGSFWVFFFAVFVLSLADAGLPNAFNSKAWPAALLFVMIGYKLAPYITRVPWQACLPAAVATWFLTPLNHGCTFDPGPLCPIEHGLFVVQFPQGALGFLPLFYLTAATGCIFILSLSRILARAGVELFASAGRKTLQLLIVHGFVQCFTFPSIAAFPITAVPLLAYPVIAVGATAFHLLLTRLASRPLKSLIKLSIEISKWVIEDLGSKVIRSQPAALQTASRRPKKVR